MSETNSKVIEAYVATRDEITKETQTIIPDDPCTVAAILTLAAQFSEASENLKQIAQVLGIEDMTNSKIAQSDTPDTMLSLLTALKATQT